MHRFHVPDLPHAGALATLGSEEARHLTQVLRLAIGDEVLVFDGRGQQRVARVEIAGKHRAEVRIGQAAAAAAEPRVRVTLAAALLKADKFDEVVRDATMMGAYAVQPLVTDRTEVPAARAGSTARTDRWRRVALSAVKQSGRAFLPAVLEPLRFGAALTALPRPLVVLAEPSLAIGRLELPPPPPEAAVLVGPEGGWTTAERDALAGSGAAFLQLGERTLRADAAPLVAMAALLWHWDAL
jgi:16S rRNA (uracil1498-N3)-methyltransferase